MNLGVSLKGTDEIETCCDFEVLITPTPYFYSLKRILVCFVLLFFTLGSNAGAQVTCPDPPNDKNLLVDIGNCKRKSDWEKTLDPMGSILDWSESEDTDRLGGTFFTRKFQRHYPGHKS